MISKKIDEYFNSNLFKPFYVCIGDDDYSETVDKVIALGDIQIIRLSQYCAQPDRKPNLDKLRETLRMADVDCDSNKVIVLGVGEYLALEGMDFANSFLGEIKDFNLGTAHVAFLLRGVSANLIEMTRNDPRLENRQIVFSKNTTSLLEFTFSSVELSMYEDTGIKRVLEICEDGKTLQISVNTDLAFSDSVYPVRVFTNSYDAIKKKTPGFDVDKKMGNDDQWDLFLKDINEKGPLNKVFDSYTFTCNNIEVDFYTHIAGKEYVNWLYYIYLFMKKEELSNAYLKYVIEKSDDFDSFKNNILNEISNISHKNNMFYMFYEARKKLVKQYPDSEVAVFVSNNRYDSEEGIYKLTDNTRVEREEIIADISQHGMPTDLERIYPDLSLYLSKYYFTGDTLNELLSEYFENYKKQKVLNSIEESFLKQVDELAVSRVYNRLRKRDEIVSAIEKEGTFLCWIDALGVEYLSYIVNLAKKKGLSVSVDIGRADLPTITSVNKGFYDNWPTNEKRKVEELDDVKHSEKGGYKYGPSNKYPIHLAKELEIIREVLDEAATDLALRKYDRYVIASDHGASRLAVIRNKEEKYDTDTQGEHSGRCCKAFENYDLPFATEEEGYIVLADYGRFKGSRAANVEVHGGASLEEVIVPVVTLSLKDSSIVIKLVTDIVKADYKTGVSVELFVNKAVAAKLSIEYAGDRFAAQKIDENHYSVNITSIKRACEAQADVYLDEDLVTQIEFKAVGKSASMNDDFDDLF